MRIPHSDPKAIHPALQLSLEEAQLERYRGWSRFVSRLISTSCFGISCVVLFNSFDDNRGGSAVTGKWYWVPEPVGAALFVAGMVVLVIGWSLYPIHTERNAEEVVESLSKKGDLFGLVDLLSVEDYVLHPVALNAVSKLISKATNEDINKLSGSQKDLLIKEMNYIDLENRFEIVMQLVTAAAKYGGARELDTFTRLANVKTTTNYQERIRHIVWRAIPTISKKASTERLSNNLLRATSPAGEDTSALLRPSGNSASDPLTLLRPSEDL